MSTATNGAATEAAFNAITDTTHDVRAAVTDPAPMVGPAADTAVNSAANHSGAASGLFNK